MLGEGLNHAGLGYFLHGQNELKISEQKSIHTSRSEHFRTFSGRKSPKSGGKTPEVSGKSPRDTSFGAEFYADVIVNTRGIFPFGPARFPWQNVSVSLCLEKHPFACRFRFA